VASSLVPDLVAYQGAGTLYNGATVGPLQNADLNSDWTGSGGPDDVFSVFDAVTVTGNRSGLSSRVDSTREGTLGDVTTGASVADSVLTQVQASSTDVNSSTAAARPAQPPARQANALGPAVDQVLGLVLDADSHETLIGDLAFEQVSSGMQRPKAGGGVRTTS
jgi:hypothetical protein